MIPSFFQASNWLFNFSLAYAVPPGLNTIAWKTYFIFGTFNFAAFIHVFFMYPETVGRSLEEVEEIFKQGHAFSAWAIDKNVGKKTMAELMDKETGVRFSHPQAEPLLIDLPLNSVRSQTLWMKKRWNRNARP